MTTKANFPVTAGPVVVPYGHVIGNEKWRGSEIAQRLQGKHKQIGRAKTIRAKHSPLSPSIVDWLEYALLCATLVPYAWYSLCEQAENSYLSIMYLHDQFCHVCTVAEHCREEAEISACILMPAPLLWFRLH
uniref:Uncharacterized protein n=1 Tax=Strix occidentalis caurina TaxID=311401 RepID=A0A8D0FMQ9_STROC